MRSLTCRHKEPTNYPWWSNGIIKECQTAQRQPTILSLWNPLSLDGHDWFFKERQRKWRSVDNSRLLYISHQLIGKRWTCVNGFSKIKRPSNWYPFTHLQRNICESIPPLFHLLRIDRLRTVKSRRVGSFGGCSSSRAKTFIHSIHMILYQQRETIKMVVNFPCHC